MRAALILIALLSALLALPSAGDVTASHSATHWDFEDDGDFLDWRVDGGSMEPVTSRVAEGERAALLTANSGSFRARASPGVSLQPGGTYRLSGWAWVDDPNVRSFRLEIAWQRPGDVKEQGAASVFFGGTGGSYRELSTREVRLPCDVVVAGIVIVLRPASLDRSAHAYVDDVLLELVAPPAPCPTPPSPPAPPGPASAPATPPPPTGPGTIDSQAADSGTAIALPTPSHGLLVNGGFEVAAAGRPLGWRSFGGALTRVATPVRSGSFAGAFSSSSDSTKWIYQALPVTPGAWYQLDGHVYLDDRRAEAALFRVSWYTSADGSGLAVATADSTAQLEQPQGRYRYLTTGPVQAPPGVHSAKARVLLRPRSASGAVIYIDDVSFRPAAPGPVAGDGGAGATRRGDRPSSETLGASQRGVGFATPLPAPVLVRRSRLRAQEESPSGSGTMWWPWVVGGGLAAAAGAGAGWRAWRWRRRSPG